jgi:hypothetical protein
MQFRHGGPPKVVVALEETPETTQAFERLSSDGARTPLERDLVHRRHCHCGACVVPSLLSEFSRVSIDRVSATSGIASSWPHSLASYAVENHRTAATSGQSRALERKVSE